ncbi:MAG: hypothetical protein QM796_20555 [Chthoniobacteraceae bacterium]
MALNDEQTADLPKSSPTLSESNIREFFASRGEIAMTWSIEDVQSVRPDLDDAQAWKVLKACEDSHDCNEGFNWDFIEIVASELYEQPDDLDNFRKDDDE